MAYQGNQDPMDQQQDPGNQNPATQPQSNPQQQGGQGPLRSVRNQAEQQIDQSIDDLAKKVPGGEKFAQQAKDAADNALDTLEAEAEKRMGGLGGLLGKKPEGQ